MASITATTGTSTLARASLISRVSATKQSPIILGLPTLAKKGGVRCSLEAKPSTNPCVGAALVASVATISSPALALVDERLSTEGTGLSLGISNNLLAWILFGVFGLIWALYFIYTSTLEEDEESGLSL
ncbi:hypothetical protein AMTRI_Chr03g54410 [Amborella trichopoda]